MIVRRMMHVYNTSFIRTLTEEDLPYNPAFMNPDDMEMLGLSENEAVEITSDKDTIIGVVQPDATLRRGLVSMSFGFGSLPDDEESDYFRMGSNTARLLSNDQVYDRYSGQPLMSNIRVDVQAWTRLPAADGAS